MILALSLAADTYRRYPGETLTLFARVEVGAELEGFRLQIMLPDGLTLIESRAMGPLPVSLPQTAWDNGSTYLIWEVICEGHCQGQYEYQVAANILPTREETNLTCRATAIPRPGEGQIMPIEETVTIAVLPKGRYLKYLPAIYQDDELMGRFLILFESFLEPIDQQIAHQSDYFDPKLAPPAFLPWLASWTNLVLDESLPEDRRRKLLEESAFLYRRRGTRLGLQRYLELFSGGQAQIIEHFSENFTLGAKSLMGQGIALGLGNIPHTFSVRLRLPPESSGLGVTTREHKIVALIEAEKPVHAGYQLEMTIDPELNRRD